jgi:hypothetical protein
VWPMWAPWVHWAWMHRMMGRASIHTLSIKSCELHSRWLFIACLHRRTVLCVQYAGDESLPYPNIVLNPSSPPQHRPDTLSVRGGTPDSTNQQTAHPHGTHHPRNTQALCCIAEFPIIFESIDETWSYSDATSCCSG